MEKEQKTHQFLQEQACEQQQHTGSKIQEEIQAKKIQERRPYARKGTRSQTMMTFRLDNENALWLATKPNKGRYINELIAKDRRPQE